MTLNDYISSLPQCHCLVIYDYLTLTIIFLRVLYAMHGLVLVECRLM